MLALVLSMQIASLSLSHVEQPQDRLVRGVVVGAMLAAAGTSSVLALTSVSTKDDEWMFAAPSIAPFAAIAGAMIGAVVGHFDAEALRAERAGQRRRYERRDATRPADETDVE